MKKLYKSEKSKICGGVIGGLGEYFEVDPVLLRVIWLLVVIFTGIVPGIVAYLFALAIIPRRPSAVNK